MHIGKCACMFVYTFILKKHEEVTEVTNTIRCATCEELSDNTCLFGFSDSLYLFSAELYK